jgi:hypothetical protein
MAFQFPLIGGILIGLATSLFLALNGRYIGISGIFGGLFKNPKESHFWKWIFVLGLIMGGFLAKKLFPQFNFEGIPASNTVLFLGSLLVGFGSRLGNGCTSGHGVCGISRGSKRSIVATIIFMMSAMMTVFIVKAGMQ